MRSVLTGSLRTYARRYVAAALAVVIGVAFIVTTSALSSASRNGALAGASTPYAGGDVVVSEVDGGDAARLLEVARSSGADAAILGWTGQPVSRDGRQIEDRADIGALADAPSLRWQTLRSGRFPERSGEAVVDRNAAKGAGVHLGDALRIGTGDDALGVVVVGVVDSPSSQVWADVYVTQADHARWDSRSHVDSVVWRGAGSVAAQEARLRALLPEATVRSVPGHVQEVQASISMGVDVLAWMLLVFASIALFVSVLVIANTFSILFAQRARDVALLRCVGATRGQVLRSVRIEALVLGAVASLTGLAAGTGVGLGLVALVRGLAPAARLGHPDLSVRWYAAAFLVGVLVTLVAAWLPTRRVLAVSPLAALGPRATVDVPAAEGRKRIFAGAVLGAVGAGLLAVAVAAGQAIAMVLGGACTFTAVLMLGPVLVPAMVRVIGAPLDRLGPSGRLAVGNAVRDPRRTAATTAALLVGVTLSTAVLTGLAGSRASVTTEMNRQHPIDVALTASTDEGLPGGLLDDARAITGVGEARGVPGVRGSIAGVGAMTVLAPTPADAAAAAHGSGQLVAPRPGVILLPYPIGSRLEGKQVLLTVQGKERRLRVLPGDGWGEAAAIVAPETLSRLAPHSATAAVWVRAAAGADAEDLVGDLSALVSGVDGEVENALSKRAYVDLQLDILTASVLGLLAIAVLVALIGIANTLGLSVLERGREHALLRALGFTRRQLRTALGLEALLCTAVAATIGTAVGVLFAWVGVHAVVRQVVDETPFVLPVGQLALVVVGTGVAGLLAAIVPARRAAKVSPAAGLALD